jgi:hypothetical protein
LLTTDCGNDSILAGLAAVVSSIRLALQKNQCGNVPLLRFCSIGGTNMNVRVVVLSLVGFTMGFGFATALMGAGL